MRLAARHSAYGLLALCGLGVGAFLAGTTALPDLRPHVPRYLLLLAGAFACYGLALLLLWRRPDLATRRRVVPLVILVAVAIRLPLIPTTPTLSTDIHRYLWDGKVASAGINPYRYSPNAAELRHLHSEPATPINFPPLRTPYQPVAQLFFQASFFLHGGRIWAFKALLGSVELALMLLLAGLLARAGLPRGQLLIYAWHPLAVAEVALGGHIDVLGTTLLAASLLWLIRTKMLPIGGIFFGLAVQTKLHAAVALPLLLRRGGHRWLGPALAIAAGVYLPYLGARERIFDSLAAMLGSWQHNGSLYSIFQFALRQAELDSGTSARLLSSLVGAGLVLALSTAPVRDERDLYRRLRAAFLFALLASPFVPPWYLLWLLPFTCLAPSASALAWSALVSLLYLDTPPNRCPGIGWWEYIPVYALLAWEVAQARLSGAPGKPSPPGPNQDVE
ncbi:MAG: DUF2029 domain-containing protein [Armatimonadetes bacterium]|nr:DUF2029 domain-containing protein [Armatimonadota bacterium]